MILQICRQITKWFCKLISYLDTYFPKIVVFSVLSLHSHYLNAGSSLKKNKHENERGLGSSTLFETVIWRLSSNEMRCVGHWMHEIEFLIIVIICVINSHWSMQRGEHVIAVVIAFRLQKKITIACAASALSTASAMAGSLHLQGCPTP